MYLRYKLSPNLTHQGENNKTIKLYTYLYNPKEAQDYEKLYGLIFASGIIFHAFSQKKKDSLISIFSKNYSPKFYIHNI